jgi:serine/threonine protein kinase
VLGVIFYEALTGHRPFGGATFEGVLRDIQLGRAKPVSDYRPDVPSELSHFVMRTLSPNPRMRPSSAKEMQDELRAIFEARRNTAAPLQGMATLPSATTPSGGVPIVPAPPAKPSMMQQRAVSVARATGTQLSVDTANAFTPISPPSTRRGVLFEDEDPYEETQTKRDDLIPKLETEALTDDDLSTAARRFAIDVQKIELPKLHGDAYGDPADESSTASGRLQAYVLDEASADNSDRTVPPPRPSADASIDVSFEEAVDRTVELLENGISRQAIGVSGGNEEEETETMELTPELRARVEQLMAVKPAPRGVGEPRAGPPTPAGPRQRKR